MCFLSDFFLWESYLIFFFFDLKALFWFTIKQQEVIFFSERLPVSDVEKKRENQSSMWYNEKNYSNEPEAVRAAGKVPL